MRSNMCIDVAPIRAAGLPLGPLGEPMTLYRTASGSVFHSTSHCSRIARPSSAQQLSVVPAQQRGVIRLCSSCCYWSASVPIERAMAYAKRAVELLGLRRRAASDSDKSVAGLLVELHSFLEVRDELYEPAEQLRAELSGSDRSGEHLAFDVAVLLAALAVQADVDAGRLADHGDLFEELSPLCASSPGPIVETWARLVASLRSGSDLDVALSVAVAPLVEFRPGARLQLGDLPSSPRFAPGAFPSPQSWAAAEWEAAWSDAVAAFPSRCQEVLHRVAADLSSAPLFAVVVSSEASRRARELFAQLLVTFPSTRINASFALVAPAVLLERFVGPSELIPVAHEPSAALKAASRFYEAGTFDDGRMPYEEVVRRCVEAAALCLAVA